MVRTQLEHLRTVEDVVLLLQRCRRLIVITGAGISVNCGIPDFRSPNGIYNTVDCEALNIPSPELLFDISYFRIDPIPFYTFSRNFYNLPGLQPSKTHMFIANLEKRKKLLRNYTQNIDGIERLAGISKCVECHGTLQEFRCVKCRKKGIASDIIENLLQCSAVPKCSCSNYMKPEITFFGEAFPKSMMKCMDRDVSKCDAILVIGTSLKVGGSVLEILKNADEAIPQILINKEAVQLSPKLSHGFDVSLLGCCDDIVSYLETQLGWRDKDSTSAFNCSAVSDRVFRITPSEIPMTVPTELMKGARKRRRKS